MVLASLGGQHTAQFLAAVGRCACASTHHSPSNPIRGRKKDPAFLWTPERSKSDLLSFSALIPNIRVSSDFEHFLSKADAHPASTTPGTRPSPRTTLPPTDARQTIAASNRPASLCSVSIRTYLSPFTKDNRGPPGTQGPRIFWDPHWVTSPYNCNPKGEVCKPPVGGSRNWGSSPEDR